MMDRVQFGTIYILLRFEDFFAIKSQDCELNFRFSSKILEKGLPEWM